MVTVALSRRVWPHHNYSLVA